MHWFKQACKPFAHKKCPFAREWAKSGSYPGTSLTNATHAASTTVVLAGSTDAPSSSGAQVVVCCLRTSG
ncbi:hypothetical protein CFter6_1810 [Collimonas fungivorans]|uniref:Uncharacterized protein n=1 Tax=Collimonas fungivorans TaxID=158899 RepID=A0A127P9S2_9BURK|nr:hypothetical protein CFter6_1810 [Collimonas fungivorans]